MFVPVTQKHTRIQTMAGTQQHENTTIVTTVGMKSTRADKYKTNVFNEMNKLKANKNKANRS